MTEDPALFLATGFYSYKFDDLEKYQKYDVLRTLPAFDDSSVAVLKRLGKKEKERQSTEVVHFNQHGKIASSEFKMEVDEAIMLSDRKLLLVSMSSHMYVILCLETGKATER